MVTTKKQALQDGNRRGMKWHIYINAKVPFRSNHRDSKALGVAADAKWR